MLVIYEALCRTLFLFICFVNLFFRRGKFKKFVDLRRPAGFLRALERAKNAYHEFCKENFKPPVFWFHFASAGELEQALPIARKLAEGMGCVFFVTYYSPSAEPFLKNFPALLGAAGLPIESWRLCEKTLKTLCIEKIFFVRYDIWPSLFFACKKNGTEALLLAASSVKTQQGLSGYFSKLWFSFFYKKMSHVFLVNEKDIPFFSRYLEKSRIHYAGDAKWERASFRAQNILKNKDSSFLIFSDFCFFQKSSFGKKIVVFGSAHAEELQIALNCACLKEQLFLVYVPHEINVCAKLLQKFTGAGFKPFLYSSFVERCHVSDAESQAFLFNRLRCDMVIVDRVGILAELYRVGDVAVVGGGFDGNIHNVLEPAAHGLPVLFGNRFERADEAKTLVEVAAAYCFKNTNELFQFLRQWVTIKESGQEFLSPDQVLATARLRALQLFRDLPKTSEIVLQVLLDKQK